MSAMRPARCRRRAALVLVASAILPVGVARWQPVVAQDAPPFEVWEASVAALQTAMSEGRVTAERLVELYLRRIDAYDRNGPRLNSVLYLNPNARRDARSLDRERSRRRVRGPLHGIPVLLKDNIDTRDMPTTGGSLALRGVVPRDDAHLVKRLREAGAVILGKVNLHELALGLTTVSSLGGQTLNPYDVGRAPGGSSGGSGVAAAASFAAFTIGTDTSGSIRIPSAHNSLVGLRPTTGLISRTGIIPFSHTQDTAGPMARTVEDVAVALDALAGGDAADPATASGQGRIPDSYVSALNRDTLDGTRIGILEAFFGTAPEDQPVAAIVRRAIDEMTGLGATAVVVSIPKLADLLMASNLLTQELKFDLRDYLARTPRTPIASLEELLETGLHTAQVQGFIEGANALADDYPQSAEYRARLEARRVLGRAVLQAMDDHRLDALVYPTVRRIAPLVGGNQAGSNAGLSAQTGFPAITVPAGFTTEAFPVGIELLGRPFAEPVLLGLAHVYERGTRHRRSPVTTPALRGEPRAALKGPPVSDTGQGSVAIEVTATGAQSMPPSRASFRVTVRFTYHEETRALGWNVVKVRGPGSQIAGIYLHRRANRSNGGVARILATAPDLRTTGRVTLTEAEAADLAAGKFYVSAIDARNLRSSARGNLVLP